MVRSLGLPDATQQRDAELLAFAQVLRLPQLTLLRRRADGADPLGNSAFVERLSLALAERGERLGEWQDPRVARTIEPTPIHPGAPTAPAGRLPQRLSASTFEALRDCPIASLPKASSGARRRGA
jgi:ATP-dependent helicase/nuclease subunit B